MTAIYTLYEDFWTSSFHLTPNQILKTQKYFIHYWSSNYVLRQLLRGPRIIKDSIPYQPIFLDGITQDDLSRNPDMPVRLSFRLPKLKKTGYVLITRTKEIKDSKDSKETK